jgi:hypothetical protein
MGPEGPEVPLVGPLGRPARSTPGSPFDKPSGSPPTCLPPRASKASCDVLKPRARQLSALPLPLAGMFLRQYYML